MIPACDTLRILHLPPHLNNEQRNKLLQRYGAIETRTLRRSSKYVVTFAKFPTQQLASEALLRLHQLNVKGQYLTVEYAKQSIPTEELTQQNTQSEPPASKDTTTEITNKSHFEAFLRKLNNWTMNRVFSQPPLPNIRYKYPTPTKDTLIRIMIQLLQEPAFYTQVLHLMNKMNLPPPFEELDTEFPALQEIYDTKKYKDIFGSNILNKDTIPNEEEGGGEEEEEGSEIESDKEDFVRPLEIIPIKRKKPQSTKRLKIPKFVNPAKNILISSSTQKTLKPEDMFEPVQRGEIKNFKIELKTLDRSLNEMSVYQDNAVTIDGGFGLIPSVSKTVGDTREEKKEQVETQRKLFITSEELSTNRISINDQRLLPVFKNYYPGKPSNRLYIKNLSKQVGTEDLHYIYQRYVITGLKDAENEYNVRLMQEGRMKGQAFITLQNVMQAQLALDETNGYILKDKPMVVQFAKVVKS